MPRIDSCKTGTPKMVKKVQPGLIFFALLLSVAQFASLPVAAAEVLYDSIGTGGRERQFILVLPDGAQRGVPMPTVVALHGAEMNGKSMRRIFGLDEIAEHDRFALVYPDAVGRRWSDGANGHKDDADDVRFLRNLADHLVRRGIADPKRLYLLGVSNGGMMTYRIACQAPHLYTAYAAVVANMPKAVADDCRPGGGAPLIVINSTEDPFNPYEADDGNQWSHGEVLSTLDTVDFWQRNNGCGGVSQEKPLPDKDAHDGSTVLARQYADCRSGSPVVLLTVQGGGHLPPGVNVRNRPMLRAMLGRANQDISAADISWKFFKRFPQ
jgi:polyhydroxybutyrate depolymerase